MKIITATKGFTLVELMVASLLAVIILTGLIKIYLSSRTTLQTQQALAVIQENGRFAIHILQQRIRMAGYFNCGGRKGLVSTNKKIQVYPENKLPEFLQTEVVHGTKSLVLWECRNINDNDVFTEVAYFVGDTQRVNHAGNKILGLFEKPKGGVRRELVSGVENMHISYKSVQGDNQSQKIIAVAIELLLSSEENFLSHKPYIYNNLVYLDGRLRKTWHTYIALRES